MEGLTKKHLYDMLSADQKRLLTKHLREEAEHTIRQRQRERAEWKTCEWKWMTRSFWCLFALSLVSWFLVWLECTISIATHALFVLMAVVAFVFIVSSCAYADCQF